MTGHLYMLLAVVFEVIGTNFIKESHGFTNFTPTMVSIASYVSCLFLLSKAMQHLPLFIVYTYWCALGIVFASLSAVFIWKEKVSPIAMLGIGFIIVGIVLVNFNSNSH